MLILSTAFVLFTVIVFGIYYIPQLRNYQVYILIIASLFFYYYNNPLDVIILLISIAVNTIISYEIHMHKRHALLFAVLGIVANVLILSLFKYNSIISHALSLGQIFSNKAVKHIAVLSLPLGISYFTFQGISLLVDSYRQTMGVTDETIRIRTFSSHFINSALFLSFFPKQSSGPIITAHKFFPQLEFKFFQTIDWQTTFKYIIGGLFLKFVIADNLKDYTFWMRYPEFTVLSSIDLIMLMYGYAFQFFADFAGYSLIAIGIGHLFGYSLPMNFNYPYIASSFGELWRRWHISFSFWLRDYVYIPLGGSRSGKARKYLNLVLTFIVSGIWHGTGLNYIIWGSIQGIVISIEDALGTRYTRINYLVRRFITFFLFAAAATFFRLDVKNAAKLLVRMFGYDSLNFRMSTAVAFLPLVLIFGFLIIDHWVKFYTVDKQGFPEVNNKPHVIIILCVLLLLALIFPGQDQPFIYFKF